MEEEFVETSDPEEIGLYYVWRKAGDGKRVLDTVRAPLGNTSKRVKLSLIENSQKSRSLDGYISDEDDDLLLGSDASQDPLLIQAASPPPETEALGLTDPMTPATSIFSLRRSQSSPSHSPLNSQDPLRIFSQRPKHPFLENNLELPEQSLNDSLECDLPLPAVSTSPSSSGQPTEDDLVRFSPSSLSPLSSPTSSPSSPQGVPQSQLMGGNSSPPQDVMDLPEARDNQSQESPPPADDVPLIDLPMPRYALRQRTKRQQNPYRYDKAEYENTVGHVPEAIVKHRSPRRDGHHRIRRDQYEEDDESQDLACQDSDGDEQDDPLTCLERTGSLRAHHVTDSILPELSESDEEERKQKNPLRKKRREEDRKRKKEEAKAAAEEVRRREKKVIHSFPLDRDLSNERDRPAPVSSVKQQCDAAPCLSHRTRVSSFENNDLATSPLISRYSSSLRDHSLHSPIAMTSPLSYSPSSQPRRSRSTTLPLASDSPNTYDTPIVIGSDRENDSIPLIASSIANDVSSDSEDDKPSPRPSLRTNSARRTRSPTLDSDVSELESAAAKKERRRLRTLQRMYPKFMLSALDKEAEKNRRQQRLRDASAPPEPELAPGHAKKTLRKGKALAEIKGDSETSEDEDVDTGRSVSRNHSLSPTSVKSPSEVQTPLVRHSHPPNLFNTPSTSSSPRYPSHIRSVKDYGDVVNDHTDVIDIPDDSSESSSSSSSEIDALEINSYVHGKISTADAPSQPRHESLIDYMLAKDCRIGRKQRSDEGKTKGKGKERGGGRKKHNDGGVDGKSARHRKVGQNYKQTCLTFDNHRTRHSESSAGSRRPVSSNREQRFTSRSYSPEPGDGYQSSSRFPSRQPPHAPQEPIKLTLTETDKKKKCQKQKDKERRERAKTNDRWTFAGNGISIDTGRRREIVTFEGGNSGETGDLQSNKHSRRRRKDRKNVSATDLVNEDFRNAIASVPNVPKPRPQHHSALETAYREVKAVEEAADIKAHPRDLPFEMTKVHSPEHDHTKPLNSGMGTFARTAYIGKGLLSQLVGRLSRDDLLTPSYSARGFTIDSQTTSADLQAMLPGICNGALDSLNDLPDDDDDDDLRSRDWEYLLRGVCWAISHHTPEGKVDTDKEALQSCIREESVKMVSRLQDATVDLAMLNLCWFAAEILLQASFPPTSPSVLNAMKLLAKHAFRFDVPKLVSHIRNNTQLTNSSPLSQRVAELWVCLIYVIPGETFWKIVEDILQHEIGGRHGFEASETIWSNLFGFCALAQFTHYGVSGSTSQLPPAWNLVSLALKQVRLGADDGKDRHLLSGALRTRDQYIRWLVIRCFLLATSWKWSLDSSAGMTMFNQLLEIFRSRNFANLIGEKAEFPSFLYAHDWEGCRKYNGKQDTAFVLCLKLIFQTARGTENEGQSGRVVNSKIKKLLSLVTPQSALAVSKDKEPTSTELSMLYNRVAAVSLAIYLDRSTSASRLSAARKYINFQQADVDTRTAFIRCLMRLSTLMGVSGISMTEIFAWFGDIGDVLAQEIKDKDNSFENAVVCAGCLLNSMGKTVLSFGEVKKYPDPGFLVPLNNLFQAIIAANNDAATSQLTALFHVFFSERAKIVPPPARPILPMPETEESQESQYEVEQWDLNDPQFLAAFKDEPAPSEDYTAKDSELFAGGKLGAIRWFFFRQLKVYVQKENLIERLVTRVEECVDIWLGCVDIVLRCGEKSKGWLPTLTQGKEIWTSIKDVRVKRRIKIRFMYTVLKLAPKAYLVRLPLHYFISLSSTYLNHHCDHG
ncbi:hypothetical protein L218DRAFT_703974 [Marasmius fiardii PR-910]|nr:hypothetical protein L218DRAFT_703974 [Marasmius fiardii PR-910]